MKNGENSDSLSMPDTPTTNSRARTASASYRRLAPTLLRLLVAGGILFVVFQQRASLSQTLRLLADIKWPYWIAGLMASTLGEFVTAYKWQVLTRQLGHAVRMGRMFRVALIGMFYNNLLPTSLGGDIVRIVMVSRESGGTANATASTFMQRNTGFAGLLIVAVIASCFPPLKLEVFPAPFDSLNYVGIWFAGIAVAYTLTNYMLLHDRPFHATWSLVTNLHNRFPRGGLHNFTGKLLPLIQRVHKTLLVFREKLLWPVALSVTTQMIDNLMVFLGAQALGLPLTFQHFCVFVPVTILAALLPISVNGIGMREACYLILLKGTGVTPEQAVAISFVHFGYILILSLVGGLLHLTDRKPAVQKD